MGHFDNAAFHYCYSLASKIENSEILKFSNDGSYLLLTSRENVYVLTFEESDNLSYGFCLMWDNLPDGSKKGYLVQHVGKDPKVLKLAKEEDYTTMDSVRTAIKIGEEVQSELQSINGDAQKEIDTTYIDGKWAVTSKYHRDILRAMDHISDYQDGFPALHNKVQELVEHSKDASEVQLASIGFALKREASRYELLLTPEQFPCFGEESIKWRIKPKMLTLRFKTTSRLQKTFCVAKSMSRYVWNITTLSVTSS